MSVQYRCPVCSHIFRAKPARSWVCPKCKNKAFRHYSKTCGKCKRY